MSFRSNRSDRSKQDSISGLYSLSCLSQSVPVRQPCGESGCVEPSPLLGQLANLGRSGKSRRPKAYLTVFRFRFSSRSSRKALAVVDTSPDAQLNFFILGSLSQSLAGERTRLVSILYCNSSVSNFTRGDALGRESVWESKLVPMKDAENSNAHYIYTSQRPSHRYNSPA